MDARMQVADDRRSSERSGAIAMHEQPAVALALFDGVAENGEGTRAAFVISGYECQARDLT